MDQMNEAKHKPRSSGHCQKRLYVALHWTHCWRIIQLGQPLLPCLNLPSLPLMSALVGSIRSRSSAATHLVTFGQQRLDDGCSGS